MNELTSFAVKRMCEIIIIEQNTKYIIKHNDDVIVISNIQILFMVVTYHKRNKV